MSIPKTTVLVTGATGQIGGFTLNNLLNDDKITVVAAVRSVEKAQQFASQGIKSVILDFDKVETLVPALEGIDRAFLSTGYTVDMLRQSKSFLDAAKQCGVKHIVHLGACGRDDSTVGHWVWHQFVERYIEWCGFSFTHLRPEVFMQNLLSYDGTKPINQGVIQQFIGDEACSWVDGEDVGLVAAEALMHPERHGGKTYRLGYDAKSYQQIADLMSEMLGQPFSYQACDPQLFLDAMQASGAEMAYMRCVYDNFRRIASRDIPGVTDTFDNFPAITGKQPVRWREFIEKHRSNLAY